MPLKNSFYNAGRKKRRIDNRISNKRLVMQFMSKKGSPKCKTSKL